MFLCERTLISLIRVMSHHLYPQVSSAYWTGPSTNGASSCYRQPIVKLSATINRPGGTPSAR